MLWFDVEQRYRTITVANDDRKKELWFDVEQRNESVVAKVVDLITLYVSYLNNTASTQSRGGCILKKLSS